MYYYLPTYLVHNDYSSGALVTVLEEELCRRVGIYAVYPQSQFVPPKTRALIGLLSHMCSEEADKFCKL